MSPPAAPLPHRPFDRLRAAIRQPRVTTACRALLRAEVTDVTVGFPCRATPELQARWLRHAIALGFGHMLDTQPCALWVLMPGDTANALAERLLGGEGQPLGPLADTAPSDGELGALGYLVARLCSAVDGALVLRDLGHAATVVAPEDFAGEGTVLWPVVVHTSLFPVELKLLLPASLVAGQALRVRLTVPETVDPAALAELAIGDVLASETSALTVTTSGLAGLVHAAVDGLLGGLHVELDGHHARGTVALQEVGSRHAVAHAPRSNEVVLCERQLSVYELCDLAHGTGIPWCVDGRAPGLLRKAGEDFAQGTLVTVRGALGLRIEALHADGAERGPAEI